MGSAVVVDAICFFGRKLFIRLVPGDDAFGGTVAFFDFNNALKCSG